MKKLVLKIKNILNSNRIVSISAYILALTVILIVSPLVVFVAIPAAVIAATTGTSPFLCTVIVSLMTSVVIYLCGRHIAKKRRMI